MKHCHIDRDWQSSDGRLAGTLQGHGKTLSLILDKESQVILAKENAARLIGQKRAKSQNCTE